MRQQTQSILSRYVGELIALMLFRRRRLFNPPPKSSSLAIVPMLIPTIGQAFKSRVGKVHGLHNLDDACPWVLHDRSLDALPHFAHCCKKTFCLLETIEFEIDDGVVRVIYQP